jgi:hypothetical protein
MQRTSKSGWVDSAARSRIVLQHNTRLHSGLRAPVRYKRPTCAFLTLALSDSLSRPTALILHSTTRQNLVRTTRFLRWPKGLRSLFCWYLLCLRYVLYYFHVLTDPDRSSTSPLSQRQQNTPRTRNKRVYENTKTIREAAGFDTV